MLTKDTIINNYGFDPCGYSYIFAFHYYIEMPESVSFIRVTDLGVTVGILTSVSRSLLHDGLFAIKGICDLGYIIGHPKNNVDIMKQDGTRLDRLNGGMMDELRTSPTNYVVQHKETRKIVVVKESVYNLLFKGYAEKRYLEVVDWEDVDIE